MTHLRPILFALLACLLLAVPATAQSPLDERIDMDLKDADVRETLRAFGRILDLDSDAVTIGPGVSGELTLTLRGVRLETLLTAVCESVGCHWSFDGARLTFTRDAQGSKRTAQAARAGDDPFGDDPIDISLKDARLGDILQAFATVAEMPVEISPEVDEETSVTVELDNVPVSQALDVLCEVNGCRWSVVGTGDGRRLRIDPL
jgi:type II secretory pathway component GspD/PulD (secretin)